MISLSTRAKEAIKTALAMTIAYGISLGMGWDNPYWAGFAVAMISLSTVGQSLNKGTMRMLGTLVAAAAALTFIAWFIQERWWFIAVLSLYLGFCTYMITGKKFTYFWWCCAFVTLVICVHAAGDGYAFNTAVLRVQQTGMGILVYTLVSVLLWPSSSRGGLDEATRKLFAIQAKLYRAYRGLLSGRGTAEDSRPLRMQEVQLLNQCEQTLRAAQTDSYEVWEVRHQWWRFHRQSAALMETLEHWRESFPEIQSLDQSKLLPNIAAVCGELDRRFEEIERMLAGEAPVHSPQPVTLSIDETVMKSLSHFQKAAVALTKTQIERLESLSHSLFDSVRDIKGYGEQASSPLLEDARAGGLGLDPDRLLAVFRTMAAVWVAFPIWFYLNPPGHTGFVEMATIFVMVAAMMRVDPATIVKPFLLGSLFAGVLYVFVMPHLSGYVQLGTMIFGATFAIYYLLWQPRHAMAKLAIAAQFLSVIGVQNQQTYDFAHYANTVASIALAGGLAVAISYLPPSPRPEKVFLRLLARFFRHSEHLMSRLALDREQEKGITGRWKMFLYRADLLDLPPKLLSWGGKIDHRTFPDNSPEQVQALVTSLHALAYRIKALAEARDYPQADLLVRELLDDVRAWRLVVQQQLRLWADNPVMAIGPSVVMQDRLTARLAKLEARVEETFRLTGEGQLSTEDYENFYRLLGSYRGLSESGIGYVRLAEKINWAQWREARF
jgi:uncharacterized membrane protein YccC